VTTSALIAAFRRQRVLEICYLLFQANFNAANYALVMLYLLELFEKQTVGTFYVMNKK
jgi:hypothetical protein